MTRVTLDAEPAYEIRQRVNATPQLGQPGPWSNRLPKVLGDPTLTEIAGRIGKSVAQVVLRWHIQHGNVAFPKSATPERIRENIQIFDFELEPADVATIDGLDRGEAGRDGPNPDTFAYVPPDRLADFTDD